MKIIAALCMLIDHIGMVFYPDDLRWRIIGRLAMPIFAYGIARGAFYTSSLKRYMKKMLLFSIVSQIPYMGMYALGIDKAFLTLNLNVGFTFLLALACVSLVKYNRLEGNSKNLMMIVGILGCIFLADILHCDYGSYGVLMVLIGYGVYVLDLGLFPMSIFYILLTALYYSNNLALCLLQCTGILGYGVIYATRHFEEKRWAKFFYWFYPMHMFILDAAKWWQSIR